jgi:hypothetical protein
MKKLLVSLTKSQLSLVIVFIILIVSVVSTPGFSKKEDTAEYELKTHINREPEIIIPKNGCVPDANTAVKIAEAVWLPVYGESIYDSRPFEVELLGDSLWIVAGTLPENTAGGVPYIEIQKKDGKILGIIHGQ